MKNNSLYPIILISATICNLILGAIAIALLPEKVAVHFNAAFEADRLGSPWNYLLCFILPPLVSTGLFLETKLRNEKNKNRKILNIIFTAITVFLVYIGWLMLLWCGRVGKIGLKAEVPLHILVCAPIGILFIIKGNYLPVIKRNRILGIKTSATLSSEYVWKQTHRLMGKVWVCAGIGEITCAFIDTFADTQILSLVWLAAAVVSILSAIPFITRRFKKREEEEAARNARNAETPDTTPPSDPNQLI